MGEGNFFKKACVEIWQSTRNHGKSKKKRGGLWRLIQLIKNFSKKSSSCWGPSWGPSGPSWAPSTSSTFPWRKYLNPFQPYWSLVRLYRKPAKWLTHLSFGRKNFSSKFGFFVGCTVTRKEGVLCSWVLRKGYFLFCVFPCKLFGLSTYPFNDLVDVFPKPVWAKGFIYRPCSDDILQ